MLAATSTAVLGGLFAALAASGRTVRQTPAPAAAAPSSVGTELSSLDTASEWLNSLPLTAAHLRGNVVLIDFWNYTCINWLRQVPYVRAWAEKYKGRGLVVIGVHAPEFAFEKNVTGVRRVAKDTGVTFPVVIDNDHAIWRAFRNEYWPALYFIDSEGHVRHRQFGEGEYEQSERIIQQLLLEAGGGDVGRELVSVDARGVEAAADWENLKSPETYLGLERTQNFASRGSAALDERRRYSAPARLPLNHWALSGEWTIGRHASVPNEANGRLAYRFHARDVHLVMGSAAGGTPVNFRVLIDGKPPAYAHGLDVDADGRGTVSEHRLYQLVRQPGPIDDRLFEIEFFGPGVEAFAFTFG